MHPGTKRKLIYAAIVIIAAVASTALIVYIGTVLNCLPPCQWIAGFFPHCECPFPVPSLRSQGLPGAILGFPWDAVLLGVLVVVVLTLTLRLRKP